MFCGGHVGFVGLCGTEYVDGLDTEPCLDRRGG